MNQCGWTQGPWSPGKDFWDAPGPILYRPTTGPSIGGALECLGRIEVPKYLNIRMLQRGVRGFFFAIGQFAVRKNVIFG